MENNQLKITHLQGKKSHILFDLHLDQSTLNDFVSFGQLWIISPIMIFEIRVKLMQINSEFHSEKYFGISQNPENLSKIIREIDINLASIGYTITSKKQRVIEQILTLFKFGGT